MEKSGEVKSEIEDYNQIIAQTIANSIEMNVNFYSSKASYETLKYLQKKSYKTNEIVLQETIIGYHINGETYTSTVSNLGRILKSWMDKEIIIPKGKLKKLRTSKMEPMLKLKFKVLLYEKLFEDLLAFAKGKGFLTKEKFEAAEGEETIPDAFRHTKE